jgi:hypothetical protein
MQKRQCSFCNVNPDLNSSAQMNSWKFGYLWLFSGIPYKRVENSQLFLSKPFRSIEILNYYEKDIESNL